MARKFIATSILAGCLVTTSLAGYKTFAKDPELSFHPSQKWTISRDDENAREPVCTISNQFNNGFIMQFAGTQDGFTNLNIDFRQSTFDPGKKYEVVYSVPGVVRKIVASRAFNPSLLVSDLHGKKDFTDALKSASVLDISIMDNKFRMYLTGFAKASEEYNECLFPKPPKIAAIDDDIDEVENPPQMLSPIKSSRESAMIDDGKNNTDNISITDNISASSDKKRDMEAVVAKATSIADNYKAEQSSQVALSSLDKKDAQTFRPKKHGRYTEKLAQELKEESRNYKPEDIPSNTNSSRNTDKEYEKNSKIAPELDESGLLPIENIQKTVENTAAPPEHKSVTIPAYKVKKEVASMEADFTELGEKERKAPKARPVKQAPITPPAEIESASGFSAEDFADMRKKISELEHEVYRLEKENKSLDQELKTALKDSEQERLSVASDNWDLERATMRYNEAERQIKRLGRQLQTAKAQCDQEKEKLQSMLFDPKVTQQQQLAKLSSLEEELDRTKAEMQRQRRMYEERIRILEDQLNKQQ